MTSSKRDNVDSLVVFEFLRKLLLPPKDRKGQKNSDSSLDLLVSDIRDLLGNRINNLRKYYHVNFTPTQQLDKFVMKYNKGAIPVLKKLDKQIKFKDSYKKKEKK